MSLTVSSTGARPSTELVLVATLIDFSGRQQVEQLTLELQAATTSLPNDDDYAPILVSTMQSPPFEVGAQPIDVELRWNLLDSASPLLSTTITRVDADGTEVSADVAAFVQSVTLRARAIDSAGNRSEWFVLSPFALGNDAPIATLEPGDSALPLRGDIPIEFTVSDTALDPVRVELEFRDEIETEWRRGIVTLGADSGLLPDSVSRYVIVWDSLAPSEPSAVTSQGLGPVNRDNVEIRLRAVDRADGDDGYGPWSAPLPVSSIRNQSGPRIVGLRAPTAELTRSNGVLPIVYRLVDAESDPADVACDFRLNESVPWQPCDEYPALRSEGTQALATNPSELGVEHVFLWNTRGLFLTAPTQNLTLRLRATDGVLGNTIDESQISVAVGPNEQEDAAAFRVLFNQEINIDAPTFGDFDNDGIDELFGLEVEVIENPFDPPIENFYWVHNVFEETLMGLSATVEQRVQVPFVTVQSAIGRFIEPSLTVAALSVLSASASRLDFIEADDELNLSPPGTPIATFDFVPTHMVTLDLNDDQRYEVVVARESPPALLVLSSLDSYSSPTTHSLDQPVSALVAGNFDDVGPHDLAAVLATDRTLVWWPDVDQSPLVVDVHPLIQDNDVMIAGDLDGDGVDEVAYAGSLKQTVVVYATTFADRTEVPVALDPINSIAFGDFDGQGVADLAVGNLDSSGRLSILSGIREAGGIVFGGPVALPAQRAVTNLLPAALTRDPRTSLYTQSRDAVWYPRGVTELNSYTPAGTFVEPAQRLDEVVGDFDGDGFADVFRLTNVGFSLLRGRGVGPTITQLVASELDIQLPPRAVRPEPQLIQAADFDRDGALDVLFTFRDAFSDTVPNRVTRAGILWQRQEGERPTGVFDFEYVADDIEVDALAVCDADADTRLDVVALISPTLLERVVVSFLNDGARGFIRGSERALGLPSDNGIACGRINADRAVDVVAAHGSTTAAIRAEIVYGTLDPDGTPTGDWSAPFAFNPSDLDSQALEWRGIRDVDFDGRNDIAYTSNVTRVVVRNTQAGVSAPNFDTFSFINFRARRVLFADIDTDGYPDLLASNSSAGFGAVGNIGPVPSQTYNPNNFRELDVRPLSAIADFSGDGWPDLLSVDPIGSTVLQWNDQTFDRSFVQALSRTETDVGAPYATGLPVPELNGFGREVRVPSIIVRPVVAENTPLVEQVRDVFAIAERLLPLTVETEVLGQIRTRRVTASTLPGLEGDETRLVLEDRFALDLDSGQAVIFDLPLIQNTSSGEVELYRKRVVYRRASEVSADLKGATLAGTSALPQVSDSIGVRDLFLHTVVLEPLPQVDPGDLATESGERFALVRDRFGDRFIRVVADRLGVFQAFEP
ncbi:MAG: VCBS repeat-containing protein [Myxococcota bacterium]